MSVARKQVQVLLIRHAESEFNLGQRVACKTDEEVPGDQECLVTKFNEKLLDCSITEEGQKQCLEAREICLKEDVAVVYVSPLRRALETCKQIFHDHPSHPKIIPHPLFREMVLSNCDIGARVLESKELYPEDDFSFLSAYKYPNLWSIYELLDKQKSAEVISEIEKKYNNDHAEILKSGHLHLLEIIKNLHPQTIESQDEQYVRTKMQKDMIREIGKDIPEGKKVAIVGHSRTLHAFTTEICPETGKETNSKWLRNCEVLEYLINLE